MSRLLIEQSVRKIAQNTQRTIRKKSIPESKEKVLKPCGFRTFVAAGEGFEPSHTESESAVLPLHKPAIFVRSCRTNRYYYTGKQEFVKGFLKKIIFEKVKQKMPCFFNKLFCVILCIFGSTKRPPAKVPPVAYALSCYFRAIFVCYACVFLLNMNEREQHALRRHPLGQRRVRTAPA